ncbi:hypothetical protein ADEAN_000519800 [Angomonas deanei]|uniref:Thioredoxin n=1 Tax=Angomonas deanei TaxID=59799 RepID=A0A7G2CD13_9TRYP|nr:hypothetical protein ADEAN_000519800 [Angomonas deanei]
MASPQNIIRRIFGDRKLPENLSNEAYDKLMQEQFPQWIKEFEEGGFLEKTKMTPIASEEEFLSKLQEHENDLMVIKYWKHGCIPCLSMAEMLKETEAVCQQKYGKEGPGRIVWYSVDTKKISSRQLVDYQLVSGTPMVQTFTGLRQVGDEVREMNTADVLKELEKRRPKQ